MYGNVKATGPSRRRVRFPPIRQPARLNKTSSKPKQTRGETPVPSADSHSRANLSARQRDKMATATQENRAPQSGVPPLFTQLPAIRDDLKTDTQRTQDETAQLCLPFLKGVAPTVYGPFNEHGIPSLYRDVHIAYLYDALEDYPESFVGLDASRPWMIYWALTALYLLGEDVTKFRKRYVVHRIRICDLCDFFHHFAVEGGSSGNLMLSVCMESCIGSPIFYLLVAICRVLSY